MKENLPSLTLRFSISSATISLLIAGYSLHGPGVVISAPRTCRLVTHGCKVNLNETQYVKETLEANGYVEAAEGWSTDLCIVNTCAVTAEGDAKSWQAVRRLHQAQPNAVIVVMGRT